LPHLCPVCGHNQEAKIGCRSYQQLKLFFALVDLIWRATGDGENRPFPNRERLRKWLTVNAGFYNEVDVPAQNLSDVLLSELARSAPDLFFVPSGGSLRVLKAKSIKFSKMKPGDFGEMLNRSIDVTITKLIPGMKRSDLVREIEQIAGIGMKESA